MKKLTLFIENNNKEIFLERNLKIAPGNKRFVKNAAIFWDMKNILKKYNDIIFNTSIIMGGNNEIKFSPGFWNFSQLKEKLLKYKLELEKIPISNKCKIINKNQGDINLKTFGQLLGFNKNKVLEFNKEYESEKEVNLYFDLRYISINCDIVNKTKNFLNGNLSSSIINLPITTEQILSESVYRKFCRNLQRNL